MAALSQFSLRLPLVKNWQVRDIGAPDGFSKNPQQA